MLYLLLATIACSLDRDIKKLLNLTAQTKSITTPDARAHQQKPQIFYLNKTDQSETTSISRVKALTSNEAQPQVSKAIKQQAGPVTHHDIGTR
eukprot:scaffold1988_cov230-Chaetoceros_neogracile.AAC.5